MKWVVRTLAALCATLACAEAGRAQTAVTAGGDQVRVQLDTSQLVDVPAWGMQATRLIADWYPKICLLLGDPLPAHPPPIKLVLKEGPGVAYTMHNEITVSAAWVRAHPDDIGCVVHELTHVVQHYPNGGPGWVTEGLADYVRWWCYEKTPQTRINKRTATWRDSYRTSGAFFAWIAKHHPGAIQQLNAAMRAGTFREAVFQKATDRDITELWKDFLAQWPAT